MGTRKAAGSRNIPYICDTFRVYYTYVLRQNTRPTDLKLSSKRYKA